MQRVKAITRLILVVYILFFQVGGVFAAPAFQDPFPFTGILQSITLETDSTTGVTTVVVDLIDDDLVVHRTRVSQEAAIELGLVVLSEDGKPGINNRALSQSIEIDPKDVIPSQQENQHPVGSALATFFSDIPGVNYEFVMAAHNQGFGFGTIAQTLWLTKKLKGDSKVFEALLKAKQTGDYNAFILEDGSIPENWGQLKKAILAHNGNNGVGVMMSNGHDNNNGGGNDKDKNNNGNGSGTGNENRSDKEKNQDKDNKDKDKNK